MIVDLAKPARRAALVVLLASLGPAARAADDDFERWEVLRNPFPSTGGGGVMIDGYDPKIVGATCVTDFSAKLADGQVFHNSIVFDAVPAAGGVLCTNGRWTAKSGGATGTTPFRVFIKDGVVRRSP